MSLYTGLAKSAVSHPSFKTFFLLAFFWRYSYISRIHSCTEAFHCCALLGMFLIRLPGFKPISFAMRIVSSLRRHFLFASAHSASFLLLATKISAPPAKLFISDFVILTPFDRDFFDCFVPILVPILLNMISTDIVLEPAESAAPLYRTVHNVLQLAVIN